MANIMKLTSTGLVMADNKTITLGGDLDGGQKNISNINNITLINSAYINGIGRLHFRDDSVELLDVFINNNTDVAFSNKISGGTNFQFLNGAESGYAPVLVGDLNVGGNVTSNLTMASGKSLTVDGAAAKGIKFGSYASITAQGASGWLYMRNAADTAYRAVACGALHVQGLIDSFFGIAVNQAAGHKNVYPTVDGYGTVGDGTHAWSVMYAYVYVDRTPACDLETAKRAVKSFKSKDGEIDHELLDDFISKNEEVDEKIKGKKTGKKVMTYGRNIGASITANMVVLQDLMETNEAQDIKIQNLEAENIKIKERLTAIENAFASIPLLQNSLEEV